MKKNGAGTIEPLLLPTSRCLQYSSDSQSFSQLLYSQPHLFIFQNLAATEAGRQQAAAAVIKDADIHENLDTENHHP